MGTCLFIKTCPKDYEWLKFCLRSIRKYVSGFTEIVLVTDRSGQSELDGWNLSQVKLFSVGDSPNGYVQQQIVKLQADRYTGCEHIVFVDSDCIFFRRCSPADLLRDNRPILLKHRYGKLGIRERWRGITESVVGGRVDWEYMCRMPIILHRDTLIGCRRAYPWMLDYLAQKTDDRFSEFNVLGAFAERTHPERYAIIDVSVEVPPHVVKQFWSWGGVSPRIRQRILEMLG